jgi:hypothetical protein
LHWSSHLCIFPWHQAPGPQMPKANKASMIFICVVPKKCFSMLLISSHLMFLPEPLDSGFRPPEQSANWSLVMSGLCVCGMIEVAVAHLCRPAKHLRNLKEPMPQSPTLKKHTVLHAGDCGWIGTCCRKYRNTSLDWSCSWRSIGHCKAVLAKNALNPSP